MTLAKLHEQADSQLRQEAIQNLTERLISGGTVGKCDFTDLLESEWNSEKRYAIITSEISALLQTLSNRDHLADQIRDGIIERYLNDPKNEWLIADEMGAIENDPYLEDAMELGLA